MKNFIVFFFIILPILNFCQLAKTDSLYATMLQLDAKIFEKGFNQCDFSFYDAIVANDLEFYHDKGGSLFGKEEFINSMKNGICKSEFKPKRELDLSTFSVYPMENNGKIYSAITEGSHFFSELQSGKRVKGGKAKFSILWLLDNGSWKMKRVFSYNHEAIK